MASTWDLQPSAAVEPPPSELSQQHQVPGSSSSSSAAAANQVPGPSLFEQYAHMAPPLNQQKQKNDITVSNCKNIDIYYLNIKKYSYFNDNIFKNDRLFNGAATYPAPPNMNVYPLSYAQQITRRITQEAMKARITAQMEALHVGQNGIGQRFDDALHTVVISRRLIKDC
jgi:hypothetical protein